MDSSVSPDGVLLCEQDCEFIVLRPGHSFSRVSGMQSKDGVYPVGLDDTDDLRLLSLGYRSGE